MAGPMPFKGFQTNTLNLGLMLTLTVTKLTKNKNTWDREKNVKTVAYIQVSVILLPWCLPLCMKL